MKRISPFMIRILGLLLNSSKGESFAQCKIRNSTDSGIKATGCESKRQKQLTTEIICLLVLVFHPQLQPEWRTRSVLHQPVHRSDHHQLSAGPGRQSQLQAVGRGHRRRAAAGSFELSHRVCDGGRRQRQPAALPSPPLCHTHTHFYCSRCV